MNHTLRQLPPFILNFDYSKDMDFMVVDLRILCMLHEIEFYSEQKPRWGWEVSESRNLDRGIFFASLL